MEELTQCSQEYSTAKNIIKACIQDTKQNFIYIGHYLKDIRDNRLYQEDGYADFDTFMATEIGKDKSWASKCINVASKFGIVENGQPALAEEYQDYSLSLLIEMVAMTPEQRELVTPDTEVKQAREIKKAGKEKSCESQLEELKKKDAVPELDSKGSCPPDRSYCARQEWGTEPEEQVAGRKECDKCWSDWKKQQKVLGQPEPEQTPDDKPEEQEPYQRGCITGKSRYGACSCCGSNGVQCRGQCEESCNGRCGWLDKPWDGEPEPETTPGQPDEEKAEQETVIDAKFEEVSPTEEYTPEYFLSEQQENLDEMLKAFESGDPRNVPHKLLERQKTIVAALKAMVSSLEQNKQPEEHEQPELPVLKNNDQRKVWVKDCRAWGLWYRDENIDVNYYKFDFENGSRLIAEEYLQRESTWENKKYDQVCYHLVQKNRRKYRSEATYDEKFNHSSTSESEIVEYLKDIQKKGKG